MTTEKIQIVRKNTKSQPRVFPNRAARLYWDIKRSPVSPVIFPSSQSLLEQPTDSHHQHLLNTSFVIGCIAAGVIGVILIVATLIGLWLSAKCTKEEDEESTRRLNNATSFSELTPMRIHNINDEYSVDMTLMPTSTEPQLNNAQSSRHEYAIEMVNETSNSDLLTSGKPKKPVGMNSIPSTSYYEGFRLAPSSRPDQSSIEWQNRLLDKMESGELTKTPGPFESNLSNSVAFVPKDYTKDTEIWMPEQAGQKKEGEQITRKNNDIPDV